MSGKNDVPKVDDSFGTNHLVVYCDVRFFSLLDQV